MEGTASTASTSSSEGSIIIQKRGTMRIENPFTIKVGQVFTGFGVGCGLGIGVGRPLNLGAIPVLNQVMSAASGATSAFSGIGRHVNNTLRKIGAKNIEAGIGCGVGFGHGFGVGLAVKPGVVNQIQLYIMGVLPASMQSSMSVIRGSSQDPLGSIAQFGKTIPDTMTKGSARDGIANTGIGYPTSEGAPLKSFGTRTENIINSFMQDPVLRGEDTELLEKDGRLLSENRVLRMILKHQQAIEELIQENEKLRQILIQDLKVPPSKLKASYSSAKQSPCADCFECRRKQRKR
ncbi:hypothetical protein Cgig2_026876 [Carnegiea gigantea]|uniref:Uncharacterized protein n=1 Tax=Carnegiea gigantea TaxID=171969 RepID=A0A9Q1KYX9_9CARY|nr:hypothetical protein Cgig2_026876 [Carnegiea gigantea]